MNEEIKEILENLNTASEIFDYTLDPKQCTLLLDYIINLQKLVKKYDKELTRKTQQYEYLRHHDFSKEIDKLTAESTEWESKCYDLQE